MLTMPPKNSVSAPDKEIPHLLEELSVGISTAEQYLLQLLNAIDPVMHPEMMGKGDGRNRVEANTAMGTALVEIGDRVAMINSQLANAIERVAL